MTDLQLTYLRKLASRYLLCSIDQVHVEAFQLHTSEITGSNTMNFSSLLFIETVAINTNEFAVNAVSEFFFENKKIMHFDKNVSTINGVINPNLLINKVTRANAADNVTIAGYRLFTEEMGLGVVN